ncbi:MAG: usg protein [Rubricella sp.]
MERSETELMLAGHGLLTAQILYRMPDAPSLLQTYLWQEYDLAPEFGKLRGFLDFWERELEGPLHSVRYTHRTLIRPGEWRKVDGEFTLH